MVVSSSTPHVARGSGYYCAVMSAMKTMIRSTITIDEATFPLAQGDVVDELSRRIEEALHAGGGFVRFTVVGNREVRVLITPHSRASIATEPVLFDQRGDGDLDRPFGAHYDDYSSGWQR